MRRFSLESLVASALLVGTAACDTLVTAWSIETVRGGVLEAYPTMTVGGLLEGLPICSTYEWNSFETLQSQEVVEFSCAVPHGLTMTGREREDAAIQSCDAGNFVLGVQPDDSPNCIADRLEALERNLSQPAQLRVQFAMSQAVEGEFLFEYGAIENADGAQLAPVSIGDLDNLSGDVLAKVLNDLVFAQAAFVNAGADR